MAEPPVRPATPADHPAILALNVAHETQTSPLTRPALADLLGKAFLATVIGQGEAVLIALDQHAAYASPHFQWFRARFHRFVYVDRVIVAPAARGRGHASRLYHHLFNAMRAAGHTRLCCEVNITPPNPASDAFHATMACSPLGQATLPTGKSVRYLTRSVPDRPEPGYESTTRRWP